MDPEESSFELDLLMLRVIVDRDLTIRRPASASGYHDFSCVPFVPKCKHKSCRFDRNACCT